MNIHQINSVLFLTLFVPIFESLITTLGLHLKIYIISDIDQLISIAGMVIRLSPLIPEMREAFFQCTVCGNSAVVEIDRGRIVEPTLCRNCNTNHAFTLIHNRSQFSDKQMVKLQESPGNGEFKELNIKYFISFFILYQSFC